MIYQPASAFDRISGKVGAISHLASDRPRVDIDECWLPCFLLGLLPKTLVAVRNYQSSFTFLVLCSTSLCSMFYVLLLSSQFGIRD